MKPLAVLLVALAFRAPEAFAAPGATYLFEWNSTTAASSGRLTLFLDRTLVWKSESGNATPLVKSRHLSEEEFAFYRSYFDDASTREASDTRPSGLAGDRVAVSRVDFQIPDRQPWSISFDSLTSMTPPLLRVVTALEGLRDSIDTVLPSPQDFGPGKIWVGTILKHRNGSSFRIVAINADRGVVELQGLTVPYTLYCRVQDLRFSFFKP